jgi:hypothetical protein
MRLPSPNTCLTFLLALGTALVASGCITYHSGAKKQKTMQHKKIAILSPRMLVERIGGGIIEEDSFQIANPHLSLDSVVKFYLTEQDRLYSLRIQDSASRYFARHADRLSVALQDVDTTNAILAAYGITYRNLPEQDKGKLCGLLGVDAVLYVRFRGTSGPGSFNRYSLSRNSGAHSEYSFASLHSATDTVWRSRGRGFGFFGPWHNVKLLMRKTIKKLPYRKEKQR